MQKTTVVVIGGGATGVGVLRDLAMRGIDVLLLEQRDLAYGTSSRFHGLLHSGGRYAVKDRESAEECIAENTILRRIAPHAVEQTEGFFARLPEDDEKFEAAWVVACGQAGIPAEAISPAEARKLEPNLTSRLAAVYRVPDSAVDGFRLCWQNVMSARRYGGKVLTYTEVIGIETQSGAVTGVKVRNTLNGTTETIACDFIVNAAGSWVGQIAGLAGITVNVHPDRGALIAFNHRFTERVINRLRPPSDADIFVPHGSITILGTTSVATTRPDDHVPPTKEILAMMEEGRALFESLPDYRILRVFAGTRPLYSADPQATGRAASRNFTIIDHKKDGLKGLATIVGGKLTTYRLMAERMADFVSAELGAQAKCRTAEEPLLEEPSASLCDQARKMFPAYGLQLAAGRLGPALPQAVERIAKDSDEKQLLCECELVTLAEVAVVAADSTTHNLSDIRRRTRMGMGTCQGSFCAFRGIGAAAAGGLGQGQDTTEMLQDFLEARWYGIRPVLWGDQMREIELTRGIYEATLNINGAMRHEKN